MRLFSGGGCRERSILMLSSLIPSLSRDEARKTVMQPVQKGSITIEFEGQRIDARRAGAAVLLLDERAHPGGQYFKQLADPAAARPDRQQARGRRLIDEAVALGVELRPAVEVWGGFAPMTIAASWRSGLLQLEPRALVIATGAYERGVPIPGWTLPGVMTTGAAQTLWRCYRRTPGRRVLIAGHGPP